MASAKSGWTECEVDARPERPQIHAPEVWAAGDDGTGTKVAVLDSGVDAAHPDLVERIAAIESFVPDETANDVNGHGTHVASTIAGTGAASDGRKEKGVAPGVHAARRQGARPTTVGQDSWIIGGMEWAARDQARGRQHEPRRPAPPTAPTR